MGGKKKSTQDTTSSQQSQQSGSYDNRTEYGYVPGAQSADIDALRNFQFTADPTIPYRSAAARRRVSATFGNPAAGYSTPELSAQRQLSAFGDIDERAGQESAAEAQRLNQQQYGQKLAVAGLTAPQLVAQRQYGTNAAQSSGSGRSNTINIQPGQSVFGSILGGVGSVLGGAIPF